MGGGIETRDGTRREDELTTNEKCKRGQEEMQNTMQDEKGLKEMQKDQAAMQKKHQEDVKLMKLELKAKKAEASTGGAVSPPYSVRRGQPPVCCPAAYLQGHLEDPGNR